MTITSSHDEVIPADQMNKLTGPFGGNAEGLRNEFDFSSNGGASLPPI